MSRVIITLGLIIAMTGAAIAQPQITNKTWTDGDIEYKAYQKENTFLFYGSNGSTIKFGFALRTQAGGKMLVSEIRDENTEYYCMESYLGNTVEYKMLNGQELLLMRDGKNALVEVFTVGEAPNLLTTGLVRYLAGRYVDANGKSYVFSAESAEAEGFGGAVPYKVDFNCYIPNFLIRFEDEKAYWIVGEEPADENGVRLRFEPYDENNADDWYPEETAHSIRLTKTEWFSHVADKTIQGRYPYASTRVMTCKELLVFPLGQLDLMRNEIFARHGLIFKTARYRDYFGAQPWYRGTVSEASSLLSEIERLNIEQIMATQHIIRNAN